MGCPICNKTAEIAGVEISKNSDESTIITTYSCGHVCVHVYLEERIQIQIKESLKIKVKDKMGNVLVESKIDGEVEKIISRIPSKAIQLIFKKGEIVHIHCKSPDCENEWKIKDGEDIARKFDVKNTHDVLRIVCKKCGREFFSG